MFNREMRINFVKKDKNQEATESSQIDVEEAVNAINSVFNNMMMKVTVAALGYVLLDTGRKILVAQVSK